MKKQQYPDTVKCVEFYRPALERLNEGIIQHNDILMLRNFADDMLMAFGFDLPNEDDAK